MRSAPLKTGRGPRNTEQDIAYGDSLGCAETSTEPTEPPKRKAWARHLRCSSDDMRSGWMGLPLVALRCCIPWPFNPEPTPGLGLAGLGLKAFPHSLHLRKEHNH